MSVVDKLKDSKCPQCLILEEWLEEERERRRFYENAYLSKLGTFGDSPDVATNLADLESVRRISTLSSRRKQARDILKVEHNKAELANPADLTEGERIFQGNLKHGI